MNIFDIFRTQNPNATQKPAQMGDPMNPANPNLPQNQNNGNPQNPQAASDPAQNPQNSNNQQQTQKSPEVDYSKLWEPDPANKGPANLADFQFNIDQAKIDQTFGQIDFTKTVTPELLAKIQAGGPEAISATLAAMNAMSQQAVKTAVLASTKVTENGLKSTGQRLQDNLPNLVRNHSVSSALREDNPLMKDPAFAPVVQAITDQMTRQFPQATAAEIQEHAKKYFERFASSAAAYTGKTLADPQPTIPQARLQTDWSSEPV